MAGRVGDCWLLNVRTYQGFPYCAAGENCRYSRVMSISPQFPAIDIHFDFRSDTRPGRDPDSDSKTLRSYHQRLWSKPLPDGRMFTLSDSTRGVYLHHESAELGEFFLSSDTIAGTHRKKLNHLYSQVSPGVNAAFHHFGYTIGGMIVFPGNKVDNKPTINQQRGTHPRIQDRLDLTLECISRHYCGVTSPLSEPIARYATFFDLFDTFAGYVDFFFLQDLVEADGSIRWLHDFEEFTSSPLPRDLDSYVRYRERTLDFVAARNDRIANRVV